MRFLLTPVLLLLFCPLADAQPAATELIATFRKTIGGEKSLSAGPYVIKYRGERFLYSVTDGKLQGEAFELNSTLTGFINEPQKHRKVMEMKIGIVPFKIVEVVEGDKGWYQINDSDPVVMSKNLIHTRRQREIHVEVFLGREHFEPEEWKFSEPKSAKVRGREAWEFEATTKGLDPLTLSFSKQSGLLLRLKTKATDFALLPGADTKVESFTRELHFSAWIKIGERMLPGRLEAYHDGVLWQQLEPVGVEFPKTIDAKLFAMPKANN